MALALAVLAALVAVDALVTRTVISGSFGLAAVLAAITLGVRGTAAVAALAVVSSSLSGLWNDNFGTTEWAIRLVISASLGCLALLSASIRSQREADLRRMTVVAETAQRALLRTVPSRVGSLGLAARYVSATREAQVGGDLYDVVPSPQGVRLIVGDVRGKGLEAVQLAATVLGAFRQLAYRQLSLSALAVELDAVVRAVAGEEDFVTAVLLQFDQTGHDVTVVNCGHHPPLIVGLDTVELLEPCEAQPPLGLSPRPRAVVRSLPSGARLLAYTDGLVEARDRNGAFFPLVAQAAVLRRGTLDEALDRLTGVLTTYCGKELEDDLALVLTEPMWGAADPDEPLGSYGPPVALRNGEVG